MTEHLTECSLLAYYLISFNFHNYSVGYSGEDEGLETSVASPK